jgi:hypothetical protein
VCADMYIYSGLLQSQQNILRQVRRALTSYRYFFEFYRIQELYRSFRRNPKTRKINFERERERERVLKYIDRDRTFSPSG